jgi:hypothetical protein
MRFVARGTKGELVVTRKVATDMRIHHTRLNNSPEKPSKSEELRPSHGTMPLTIPLWVSSRSFDCTWQFIAIRKFDPGRHDRTRSCFGALVEDAFHFGDLPSSIAWTTLIAACMLMLQIISGCGTPGVTRLSSETPAPDAKLPETVFLRSVVCQDCHPAEYEEWRTSMHAYAQHSPIFLAFNKTVLKNSGGTLGTFCARCHTPVGISSGETSIMANDKRSEAALDSVGCVSCHSTNQPNQEASAVYHVPVPGDQEPIIYGPYYGSDEPGAPDPSMRLIKSPHISRHSDYFTEARLCGNCHDVFSPDGFRIEEAFSEWRNGPYARAGITCQNCHMAPIPGKPVRQDELPLEYIADPSVVPGAPKRHRSSHRFTGPDYSVLLAFGKDDLGLDKVGFQKLTDKLEEQRKTLFRNAASMQVSHPETVQPGSSLPLTVAVTNSGAGHNLPTGFAAERQVWLEVILRDSGGHVLYSSGSLDSAKDLRDEDSEDVQNGTFALDRDLFNLQATFISAGFRGTEAENISTVNRLLDPVPFVTPATSPALITGFPTAGRIFKRGIPPLATKTAHYKIGIPADAKGPLSLSVRLRYRNLPPHLLKELGIPELRPKLRIVDMQGYQSAISVQRDRVESPGALNLTAADAR